MEHSQSRNEKIKQANSGPASKTFLLSNNKPGKSYDFDAIKRRGQQMYPNLRRNNPMSGTQSLSTADYFSNVDGEVISMTELKRRQIHQINDRRKELQSQGVLHRRKRNFDNVDLTLKDKFAHQQEVATRLNSQTSNKQKL